MKKENEIIKKDVSITTKKTTPIERDKILPIKRISPTSVNTWSKCPREFYYSYMEKQPIAPNIALVKGSVVHKVLELFYKEYREDYIEYFKKTFEKEWKKEDKKIKMLELTPEQLKAEKADAYGMIMDYSDKFDRQIKSLIRAGKVENERHAFYLLRPKFRELWVEDKDLHCAGFIDRVHKGFDGSITLGDYKTSSKYGIGLPDSFKRQLSIYALLYNNVYKVMPDYVSIIFLRYGEEYILEVTPSLLKYARNTLTNVWSCTRSTSISDYPMHEGKLCRWCSFKSICDDEKNYKDSKSKDRLKKLFKKDTLPPDETRDDKVMDSLNDKKKESDGR